MQHAYQQLGVGESSQEFLTINTYKGLYQYTQLPFGISSAPSIFQAVMDQILKGKKNIVCYLDDIFIMGQTLEAHNKTLNEVLQWLHDHGIKLKLPKCKFLQKSMEYLGHKTDATGLQPTADKMETITKAPRPQNTTELKSYLGLLNYYNYNSFLPNLSTTLYPLNALLCKFKKWTWSPACDKAFNQSKRVLVNSSALAHYDTSKPIRLTCDASPYGVGAVISQVEKDGQERPVAFASRSLSTAGNQYAQIERKALALIFRVKKFHQCLYGRAFTLQTDHKPVMTILWPKTAIPKLAVTLVQRWVLILSAYTNTTSSTESQVIMQMRMLCPDYQQVQQNLRKTMGFIYVHLWKKC